MRSDSPTLVMDAPRLLGDTLVGWVAGRYEEILLPEASRVMVRQPAPRRTAFLVGGVVAIGALLIAVLQSTGPQAYQPTPEGSVTRR